MRVVHLGLGHFARSHLAWYTDRADDAPDWGIGAFGGRSGGAARTLAAQDDLYTLVTRGPEDDRFELVASLATTAAADDTGRWRATLADPATAVVTVTVTEAGYLLRTDGSLDLDRHEVAGDVAALRGGRPAATAPGRLVEGLVARYRAGGGPLAVVPCDNLPANGARAGRAVRDLAVAVDRGLATWVADSVSFVSTVVDRITPGTTDEDVALVARVTGWRDRAPVVAEPFAEWVLAGAFPAGRPGWETAGARFVDDATVHEQRKLRLLNGAHSLLAYVGPLRGRTTVAGAVADEACRSLVEAWWTEAEAGIALPARELRTYRERLLERFANGRIDHLLARIAADGSQKLPARILPALREARAAGRMPAGAVPVLAGWLCHLRGSGVPVVDVAADVVVPLAGGPWPVAARRVLGFLGDDLGGDGELATAVAGEAARLATGGGVTPFPPERTG